MGAFKTIAIEIMETEEKLGRELSEAERNQIQNQYIKEQNEFIDSQPAITDAELEEMCEQCGAGVLHAHGTPTLEEIYGTAMKVDEPYYDVCDTTVKNGEAVFEVAFSDDEKYEVVTIEAEFTPYATEDEAYAEDVTFYINGGEVSEKKHKHIHKRYSKLIEELTESLDEWCADNAWDIYQERAQAAADFAYDCWKDDQMERGE